MLQILLYGYPGVQHASDIYSLGATFFNIVTRRAPWSHNSEVRKAWAKRTSKKKIGEQIRKEVNHFLKIAV